MTDEIEKKEIKEEIVTLSPFDTNEYYEHIRMIANELVDVKDILKIIRNMKDTIIVHTFEQGGNDIIRANNKGKYSVWHVIEKMIKEINKEELAKR